MKTITLQRIASCGFSLLLSAGAWAVPASDSPYMTDPQHEYVQDATSEAIGNVNMILCIANAMNPSESGMINGGPYLALIDMNKCDTKGGSSDSSSSSSGASAAANYMNAIVDVTRASDNDPMIAKVWMSMTDQGRKQGIWVRLSATQPPSPTLPYGEFRLDFIGKFVGDSTPQFNGYINALSTGELQYYETGPNSSNVALIMTANSTDDGQGTMTLAPSNWNPSTLTYDFNYNANYFRRSDGTHDQCFDRLKANAKRSVWRFGTYNANDGSRVDQANPSFPVNGTYQSVLYYGYAGYWGINFQGLDLNVLPDGEVTGLVVNDQRPPHATDTYSLSKVGGKLTKWAQNSATLADMDGIPFYFGADLTSKTTGGSPVPSGWGNWQAHWDDANSHFVVTGTQSCGQNGCSLTSMTTPAVITPSGLNNMPLSGWSDSFGGNINIPPKQSDYTGSDPVYYFTQSLVIPGSQGAPTTLYCLNNCLDAASVTAATNYTAGGAPSPFSSVTANQWYWAPSNANTVTYTYGATGLVNASTAMIITNSAFYADSPNYQYGVQSGRLFTAFGTCPSWVTSMNPNTTPVCEPDNPTEYYTWSTSPDQWNQTMWLTHTNGANSGQIVTFDPPQNIQYTVPSGAEYGTWAGKAIQLQFNGFGNVNGIPGYCVDPVNNAEVNCGPNTRYVPAFSLPDGATMTLGSTPLIIKALDAELRLNDLGQVGVDSAADTACGSMLFNSLTPPSTGEQDMTDPNSSYYIGIKPTVTDPPKVIDGIVQ
jgi:hypothetical protein